MTAKQSQPCKTIHAVWREAWRGAWEKAGSTSAYDRALIKVRAILENHTPDPLPDEVLKKIRSIVEETEREMGIL